VSGDGVPQSVRQGKFPPSAYSPIAQRSQIIRVDRVLVEGLNSSVCGPSSEKSTAATYGPRALINSSTLPSRSSVINCRLLPAPSPVTNARWPASEGITHVGVADQDGFLTRRRFDHDHR